HLVTFRHIGVNRTRGTNSVIPVSPREQIMRTSGPVHRKRSVGLVVAALIASLGAAVPAAHAVSADVVIGEVYGGGGNTGAPFANDFVELHNRGASSVSLTGWSVQYASATGSSWLVTALGGTLAPGGSYLVKMG